jgi:hypothetical protein
VVERERAGRGGRLLPLLLLLLLLRLLAGLLAGLLLLRRTKARAGGGRAEGEHGRSGEVERRTARRTAPAPHPEMRAHARAHGAGEARRKAFIISHYKNAAARCIRT